LDTELYLRDIVFLFGVNNPPDSHKIKIFRSVSLKIYYYYLTLLFVMDADRIWRVKR